jgi:hypothetical protein
LSFAGTMVWSKRIVMAYLQVMWGALGSDETSLSSGSCQRLAYPTIKQGQCQLRTTRRGIGKGLQGRDLGICGRRLRRRSRRNPLPYIVELPYMVGAAR